MSDKESPTIEFGLIQYVQMFSLPGFDVVRIVDMRDAPSHD